MSRIISLAGVRPLSRGATEVTRIADIIVPAIFSGYVQSLTAEKSRLIQSGALVVDQRLNEDLAGGGSTFNRPFFNDLNSGAGHEENISNDDPQIKSSPDKITANREIQVRLSRNKSWGSMDLAAALAGVDPMNAIANRIAAWRERRLQAAWIATMKGVFASDDAAPTGGSTHTAKDLTFDLSGTAFVDGKTNFASSAFIAATGTMGDSMNDLTMVMMHSVVYQRLMNLNLIDFIPDSRGEVMIQTYMGREVIVDDAMPNAGGVFETWLFGRGATAMGVGSPKVPVEVQRNPDSGNGGGEEILYNRWEWVLHPVGHAFVGAATAGGPSNSATTDNLAAATSWRRVFGERKQIRMARLITREFAAVA